MLVETQINMSEDLETKLNIAKISLNLMSKQIKEKNPTIHFISDLNMFELELIIDEASDHMYTRRHDKKKYFFEIKDFLPVYQELVTKGSAKLCLDAIEVRDWGSEDTSWQYNDYYYAETKKGILNGKSTLESNGINFIDLNFTENEFGESFSECLISVPQGTIYNSINKLREKT